MSGVSPMHKARVLTILGQQPAGIGFSRLRDLSRLVSAALESVLAELRRERLVVLHDSRYFDAEGYHSRFSSAESMNRVKPATNRGKKKNLDLLAVGGVEMFGYKLKFLNALAAQYKKEPKIANDIEHIRDDLVRLVEEKRKGVAA